MISQTESRLAGLYRLNKVVTEETKTFDIGGGILQWYVIDYIEKSVTEETEKFDLEDWVELNFVID